MENGRFFTHKMNKIRSLEKRVYRKESGSFRLGHLARVVSANFSGGSFWSDFNFDIVNFPFLDGDVPQHPCYDVYISQLIRFARASSLVTDFNNRNKFLTAKLLKQGYQYQKLRKAISKFYRRHFDLIEKHHVSLKKNL